MKAFPLPIAMFVLAACSSGDDSGGDGAPSSARGSEPAASGPTVKLRVTLEGTGVIRSEPAGIECPGRCEAMFPVGARVTLVAVPAEGWALKGWSGGCAGASACETDGTEQVVRGTLALVDPRWNPAVGAGDCADAWGQSGERLSPCDKTPDDYVVVNKTKRNIALCKAGALVKNARIGLGFTPSGDKTIQGDGKTPEGVFFIPRTLPDSDYHRAFLFSYPRKQDAARGYNEGVISKEEHSQIMSAHDACTEPSQETGLGGAIEIHGEGSSKDWTAGCVGLENADVDLLWSTLEVGDTIVVLP